MKLIVQRTELTDFYTRGSLILEDCNAEIVTVERKHQSLGNPAKPSLSYCVPDGIYPAKIKSGHTFPFFPMFKVPGYGYRGFTPFFGGDFRAGDISLGNKWRGAPYDYNLEGFEEVMYYLQGYFRSHYFEWKNKYFEIEIVTTCEKLVPEQLNIVF